MADSATSSKSWEEKVSAKKAECKDMKVSELKMKLMSKGILTSTFCEKDEFVTAYAEILVKQEEEAGDSGGEGQATTGGGCPAVTTVPSDDDDDGSDGEDDDGENQLLENLPPAVQNRVDELKSLHTNYDAIMKEYLASRAKLESEFQSKTQPLYEKRRDLITGKIDVSADVVDSDAAEDETSATKTKTETETDQKDSNSSHNEEQNVVGIPKFWVLTLTQMPVTASMISEHDVDCLGYLTDITCDNFGNGEGFQLNFYFSNGNPYFNNEVLTKRYDVPNLLLADEPILKNVEGCEIQWKEGKTLLERKVTKQQRGTGKNAGQVRTITKTEPCDSFFKFFVPPKMPGNDQLHTTTEEEVMKIEAAFDEDYDVAQALRSHVIPKAVQWFLGNAMEQEMEAAMMGAAGGGSGLGASSLPNGGASGENPECKQQ